MSGILLRANKVLTQHSCNAYALLFRRFIPTTLKRTPVISNGVKRVDSKCLSHLARHNEPTTAINLKLMRLLIASRLKGSKSFYQQLRRYSSESPKPGDSGKPGPSDGPPLLPRLFFWAWLSFAVYTTLQVFQASSPEASRLVSWNEFVHEFLAKGEVEDIVVRPELEVAVIRLHPGVVYKGQVMEKPVVTLKLADVERFEDKLRATERAIGIRPEHGVTVSYSRMSSWAPVFYAVLVGAAVFLVFRNLASRIKLPNPSDLFANERKAKYTRVDLQANKDGGITFKDVAGLKEPKLEIMEFVDYLKRPEVFKKLGAKTPRGALLLGPPGCGKTLLAKALAGEAQVPFLAMAGSEFVEMLGGLGAARVRDLFKEARNKAPCIIYVDEIDAIGRRRTGNTNASGNTEEEHTLNQLLVELDGMGTQEGVIMIASTNRADVLDKALLRPGRFDRHVLIDLPTMEERRELFLMYLGQLKHKLDMLKAPARLAQLTPGMSGADINNVCNEAALHAAREQHPAVVERDLDYAVERVIAGVAKRSRTLSAAERRVVAYHESGHALAGWLLRHTDALLKISIVPRTNAALGFAQYIPSDQKLYATEELFERMCMALGGRVAESLIFNRVSTGAQDDLQRVTKLAYAQVQQYGMNEQVGPLAFDLQGSFGIKPYSKQLAATIDQEARQLVARTYKHTESLLRDNIDKLHALAQELLAKEVLSYDDVQQLIGAPPHGDKRAALSPLPELT